MLKRNGGRTPLGWAGIALAGAALAVGGIALGLRLAGPVETETPLGRGSFDVAAGAGGHVDAFVPIADWGIRADAFTAPFNLEFEVRSVDRRGALAAASGERDALSGIEDDLEDAARDAILRAFGWGLATTFVLALLAWLVSRRSRLVRAVSVVAIVLAVLGSAASLAAAALTFDAKAFTSPSYYGRGQELSQLLAFFERQQGNDRYSSTFEAALTNFSAYLSETPRAGEGPGETLLLGSDLHNNAFVLPALTRFAEGSPVLLAGDFGHEGNEAEARTIAPRIAALGDPVVAVSGNHDSVGMMRALARGGVIVLGADGAIGPEGEVSASPLVEVGDLTVAGFPDPLESAEEDPSSPSRVFSFPELDDGEEREAQAKEDLVAWFEGLPEAPDVVLVHQNGLAQHLASTLWADGYDDDLIIATGHNHYQHIDRHGPITVVNAGTLGAGGALRIGQEFVGLGRMHLTGEPPVLRSVDLISVEPLSGQAQADRVILDLACPPGEAEVGEPCHYEPEGA